MKGEAFCPKCRKAVRTHEKPGCLESTDCCHDAVLYRDEEAYCLDFQANLAIRLADCDPLLPLASLVLIEKMLQPVALPKQEPQVPKVQR